MIEADNWGVEKLKSYSVKREIEIDKKIVILVIEWLPFN